VPKPVAVDVRVHNEALRALVEKAVRATRGARLSADKPDLLITDQEGMRPEEAETWPVYLVADQVAEAYTGPFVVDRAHPLTKGLALQGVIWGAGKEEELPGAPVVTAGNIPLLTDVGGLTDRHEIHLRLRTDFSTLEESPNWPILMWNLVQWRASLAPGLSRTNLRLGEETVLTLASARDTVEVVDPGGRTRTVAVQGRSVAVKAEEVGV